MVSTLSNLELKLIGVQWNTANLVEYNFCAPVWRHEYSMEEVSPKKAHVRLEKQNWRHPLQLRHTVEELLCKILILRDLLAFLRSSSCMQVEVRTIG